MQEILNGVFWLTIFLLPFVALYIIVDVNSDD